MAVPPGTYRACLRYLFNPAFPPHYKFFDVVALVLRFRAGEAARWQLALTPDDPDPSELIPGRVYGFAVDSATAAVMDASVQPLLDRDDVRKKLWAGKGTPPGGALVALDDHAQLALGATGGDGIKPAYVAFDDQDRVLAFVVDFRMVDVEVS